MKSIYKYIAALVGLQLLLFILQKVPNFIESVYSTTLYVWLNNILVTLFEITSFPIGDLLYIAVGIILVYKLFVILKNKKKEKVWQNLLLLVLKTTFLFLLSFQLFWGLNNLRVPLHTKLGIETSYTQIELENQTQKLIQRTNQLQRLLVADDSTKIDFKKDLAAFNTASRLGYQAIENRFEIAKIEHTDVKISIYSSLLTGAGFSGYLNPFTHEAQVNIDIPVVGMPVTVAHEIAHQKGIASESEANFFGYLVMNSQSEIAYQYAANLYALKYCLKEIRINDEEKFLLYYNQINYGIQTNIMDTEAFWQENKNFSSDFFKSLYGNFLKLNNQKEGIQSYNKFVDLLINYNKKYEVN